MYQCSNTLFGGLVIVCAHSKASTLLHHVIGAEGYVVARDNIKIFFLMTKH